MFSDRLMFNDGPVYPSQIMKINIGLPNSLRTIQVIASLPLMLTAKIPGQYLLNLIIFYWHVCSYYFIFILFYFMLKKCFYIPFHFALLAGSIGFLFSGCTINMFNCNCICSHYFLSFLFCVFRCLIYVFTYHVWKNHLSRHFKSLRELLIDNLCIPDRIILLSCVAIRYIYAFVDVLTF